jgi:hypothetical protein
VGGEAFDLPNNQVNSLTRINIEQEMDMFGQYLHFNDDVAILASLGKHKLFHPSGDGINEHLATILRTKDNVILTTVHDVVVSMIGLVILAQFHIPPVVDNCAQYIVAHLFHQGLKRLKLLGFTG